jgi:hypothetical protein
MEREMIAAGRIHPPVNPVNPVKRFFLRLVAGKQTLDRFAGNGQDHFPVAHKKSFT